MQSRSLLMMVAIAVLALIALAAFVPLPNNRTSPLSTETLPTTRRISTAVGSPKNYSLWLTYHHDNSRTGFDPTVGPFVPVRAGWSYGPLDGAAYAEPLVAEGKLFVATENNTVYAFNDGDGRIIWMRHFGPPVPGSDLPCGDIDPSGITSTPVIDPSVRMIYVVAFLRADHQHRLFALDLSTGEIIFSRTVDPPGANPLVEQQRAALSLSNGVVYVPYGGLFGDCGSYHGWIVGVRMDSTGALIEYQVPTFRAGGIWAPSGAAVDAAGDIFVATGNSFSFSSFDFGNSLIKLSPKLQRVDWFAPSNWLELNYGDTDLGSTGPALLDSNIIFQVGKDGVGYLIDESRLGGVGGEVFSSKVCTGAFGGTAYLPPYLYVPCTDGLVALQIGLTPTQTFTIAWKSPSFHAGPPIVVGGAVWTIDTDIGELYAFNATNGQLIFEYRIGEVAHFSTPSAGDGQVFVTAEGKVISFTVE